MFRALETNRDYCRDELGKHRHVNVPPSYFVRNFAESGRRGRDLAPCFHRIDRHVKATSCIQAKLIYLQICDPGNFDFARLFSSRQELFFIRPGCNAYLRSGRIIRLPRISAALPEENGIQVRSYFPPNVLSWPHVIHCP
jgi:hypothetical protein